MVYNNNISKHFKVHNYNNTLESNLHANGLHSTMKLCPYNAPSY